MKTLLPIKVLVVDDSALMRGLIQQIVNTDPTIEVIGQANDGYSAYIKTQELRPDVVLMDLMMGEYDGHYGVNQIMKYCPTPIIILSAMGNKDMNPILEALALGAIDYLNKPTKNYIQVQELGQQLLAKIRMASRIELKAIAPTSVVGNSCKHSFNEQQLPYDCIVIGASTGGPRALELILRNLPENLAVPVFIIQHIPASFTPAFAARLNTLTPLEVQVASINDSPKVGNIYLASGQGNLIVKATGKRIVFKQTEEKSLAYNNPSIDIMMSSVATVYRNRAIGCLLTGMGKDGAIGLNAIKNAGGYTLAQSESSCVVFGMPKAAQKAGAVRRMVHLNDIASFLVSCLA